MAGKLSVCGSASIDVNGLMDVVSSANGKGSEIYLGTKDEPFTRETAKQKMAVGTPPPE